MLKPSPNNFSNGDQNGQENRRSLERFGRVAPVLDVGVAEAGLDVDAVDIVLLVAALLDGHAVVRLHGTCEHDN